ncbi:hypothetical protein AWRI1631_43420 [Saccharomyces cerevisiae AWRI1631]|uniref:Uncharacterized protein n=1 Tax=Saccharomyces cerevisiae (strain AWRI1631) TaxID=545124 RepID=B5VG19_YEAS6|nr:hypothetical protein AWRI1631_43420 [Saccharomyces cerevisiae AWRI1631]
MVFCLKSLLHKHFAISKTFFMITFFTVSFLKMVIAAVTPVSSSKISRLKGDCGRTFIIIVHINFSRSAFWRWSGSLCSTSFGHHSGLPALPLMYGNLVFFLGSIIFIHNLAIALHGTCLNNLKAVYR